MALPFLKIEKVEKIENLALPFLKVDLAIPFLKVDLVLPFLKVENVYYKQFGNSLISLSCVLVELLNIPEPTIFEFGFGLKS